jgi:hypothetical protein
MAASGRHFFSHELSTRHGRLNMSIDTFASDANPAKFHGFRRLNEIQKSSV